MLFALLEMIRGILMPWPFWVTQLGTRGEYLARRYFHRRGYHLLEKNWRHGHGEIDLIMASRKEVVFLEVKTRSSQPDERFALLTKEQEERIKDLIPIYLKQWPGTHPWRFLLVTVLPRGKGWHIETVEL